MCLAIAMYILTGTFGILSKVFMAIGIFLLTFLGRTIFFVCALLYTVKPLSRKTNTIRLNVQQVERSPDLPLPVEQE